MWAANSHWCVWPIICAREQLLGLLCNPEESISEDGNSPLSSLVQVKNLKNGFVSQPTLPRLPGRWGEGNAGLRKRQFRFVFQKRSIPALWEPGEWSKSLWDLCLSEWEKMISKQIKLLRKSSTDGQKEFYWLLEWNGGVVVLIKSFYLLGAGKRRQGLKEEKFPVRGSMGMESVLRVDTQPWDEL